MDACHGSGVIVRRDLGHVGVEQHLRRPGRRQRCMIVAAKARRRAKLAHDCLKRPIVQLQQLNLFDGKVFAPELRFKAVVIDLNKVVCTVIELFDLSQIERPAAVWYPIPSLEINVYKRTYPATPAIGATAQLPRPAGMKIVSEANIFAPVEGLRCRIKFEPAAFKDACLNAASRKFESKCDTRDSAADDADFCIQNRPAWKFSGIDKHWRYKAPFPLEYSCNHALEPA